jgi:hypothetical protein
MPKSSKPNTKAIVEATLTEARQMGFPANLNVSIAKSIALLDGYFGDGYAKEHPQVLAACIQHEGLDINAPRGDMVDATNAVADALERVGEAISDHSKANTQS